MPPSGYEEFQARYESEATREADGLDSEPLPALLDRVRKRDFGDYYRLWPAIAAKATLEDAGWLLFEVLTSDADYLVRYHCADALIKIAGRKLAGMTPVMLSGGKGHGTPGHLEIVREMLQSTVGSAREIAASAGRDVSVAAADGGELDRRRPAWAAMSEFFLDTELTAADHERIAEVLRASGYSVGELDRILWHELCPVLWGNLRAVAGGWSGFDMAEVERQILKHPAGAMGRWWSYYAGGRAARPDWEQVRGLLAALGTR